MAQLLTVMTSTQTMQKFWAVNQSKLPYTSIVWPAACPILGYNISNLMTHFFEGLQTLRPHKTTTNMEPVLLSFQGKKSQYFF